MFLRRFKTFLLLALVIISLVTSYSIWHGTWMVNSEVGVGTTQEESAVGDVPDLTSVMDPQQVIVGAGEPRHYSVELPGNAGYEQWLKQLENMTVAPLHSVNDFQLSTSMDIAVFSFPVDLNSVELSNFIPALTTIGFTPSTDQVVLFLTKSSGEVQLALQMDSEAFVGVTNIDAQKFKNSIKGEIQSQPWQRLSTGSWSLVPKNPYPVKQYQYTLVQPKLSSLVDSFFVNTQGVTRIQENKGTVIWTDGSRAVQWNADKYQLVFEDPNAASSDSAQPASLSNVLLYMHSHGGLPATALIYNVSSSPLDTYIFRDFVDGLPILSSGQQYKVLLQQGYVVEYDRPVYATAEQNTALNEKTLSFSALQSALKSGGYPINRAQIVLGYQFDLQNSHTAILRPVYYIYLSNGNVAVCDAVTGKIQKGSSES